VSPEKSKTMIGFDDAQRIVRERSIAGSATVELPIQDAFGHVLAESITSTINMPLFNKSAMDGFAFRFGDLSEGNSFKIVAMIQAGKTPNVKIAANECVWIMTGAPVPDDCDTVIPIEDTQVMRSSDTTSNTSPEVNQEVRFMSPPRRGQHMAILGEDIKEGDVALKAGHLLQHHDVAVLATVGRATVKVYRPPSVAFAATGEELVEPGNPLQPGMIYNSNAYALWSQIKQTNATAEYIGVIKDTREDLREKLTEGLKHDILVLSGGVSMGEYDYVPDILAELGVEIQFHKVMIKPGRPTLFGVCGDTLVFGLPGNPLATIYSFMLYTAPAIRHWQHHPNPFGFRYKGELMEPVTKKSGRTQLVPCELELIDGRYQLYPRKTHGSADLFSVSGAKALAIIPAAAREAKRGETVGFRKLFE
jgi:molybdopterin molybdotransferase